MSKPFKENWETLRRQVLGLGLASARKSHYPHLRQRLQELERFRSLVDLSGDLLFQIEAVNHRILDVNASVCERIGIPRTQLIGESVDSLLQPKARLALMRVLSDDRSRVQSQLTLISTLPSADGTRFPAEIKLSCGIVAGQKFGVLAVRDITERRHAEEQLRHLALFDSLTNLPNRLLFNSQLTHAIERARRTGNSGAVLYLDLDRFKVVNESLGHSAGDELLQIIARQLRARLRSADTLARLGGDDFIVLMEEIPDSSAAADLADELIQQLEKAYPLSSGREVYISGSIGISLFPQDADSAELLIQQADAALYHAKESGRNAYRFYTMALTLVANERLALEVDLRRGLENHEFILHYQPLVSLTDGRIHGVEALVRWQPPGYKLVGPTHFIQLAEETGLIIALGEWVIREACQQMQVWLENGLKLKSMAVNLSPLQFRQAGIENRIQQILHETGLPGHYLEVEITENALMLEIDQSEATLSALKALGVRVTVDDFGTGYSSLAYIKHFPIDKLKIDQTFISDIPQDLSDMNIVSAIISMAKNLHLEVLAEGIETQAQRQFLIKRGCDSGQGFLFSRPVEADQILALLNLKIIS